MTEKSKYDAACLPDLLPIYYKKLFPYGLYYRWLNYGGVPKTYFANREFSFTLKDDVYIRYQSFSDQQELEKEIQKRCPYKIDIGAVFSHKPKDHKTVKAAAFQAQEKELVFDIDMTDYDDVRTCCSGADICEKCWPLMQVAIKVLDRALEEDFGFEHRLWVYSGRRGVHCWVCDETARKLSQNGRTAVAEYLSLVKGGEHQNKKVSLDTPTLHPFISQSLEIIKDRFDDYAVKKQEFLGDEERQKKVLSLITEEKLRSPLEKNFEQEFQGAVSKTAWDVMKKFINAEKSQYKGCKYVLEEIMLQYCYPRLDVNVSKGINHLLKSPFCVHPKTGRLCVPIDPKKIDDFDPMAVPTISDILEEMNAVEKEDSNKRTKDFKGTSLKDCIQIFEKFVKNLEETWKGKGRLIEQSDLTMEF
ncbi:DNA primase small subunit-like isoform X2 [Ostrea edulis]|uniref:DNA primase small subunit-like isoform X2 n=1 Tax=Ostrea edulis TaxID=37623 RepID=UPI0024AFB1FC|nr:DNA primase small subunit-like isoform X2 [Ostrea edulis]